MFHVLVRIATRIGLWRSQRYTKKHFTVLDVPFRHVDQVYICNDCGAHNPSPGHVEHHTTCSLEGADNALKPRW